MVTIRRYRSRDAASVGALIADTYGKFNLAFFASEQKFEVPWTLPTRE